MDFANLLTAVFGIAALVGGGLAGLMYGGLRTVRDSNTDLRARVGDLEKKVDTVVSERDVAIADRDALARVVTGETHWVALGQELGEHHSQALVHWQRDEDLLAQILTAVQGGTP